MVQLQARMRFLAFTAQFVEREYMMDPLALGAGGQLGARTIILAGRSESSVPSFPPARGQRGSFHGKDRRPLSGSRAVQPPTMTWFWIGTHAGYDRLVSGG